MPSFWIETHGQTLEQGDYLQECWIPIVGEGFGPEKSKSEVSVEQRDLIIVTQSCDLVDEKNRLAALCPIYALSHWEQFSPAFGKKGVWESVRKGRVEGLHMLGAIDDPSENRSALVVDFRQIFSLPVAYLQTHAGNLGKRWRLQSPFREHLSQAFARFFMRVGLPAAIPAFN